MLGFLRGLFSHNTYHDIIDCLTTALEARDHYTAGHSCRVGDISYDLAKALGIRGHSLSEIHMAAHLHDIGKIGVPEAALNKPGKLLPHEWAQIQQHPEIGYRILCRSKNLRCIAEMVLQHHERWDGKGYPKGLCGERVCLGSRIIGLADAIDAMTSERPYRKAMSWSDCRTEIEANKGLQFDPVIADAAAKLWPRWEARYLRETQDAADYTGTGHTA